MDGYYYELLEERKKTHDLAKDSAYKRIQEKLRSTMGPLCKLWYLIEESVANPDRPISKEDREEMAQYVDQTVMLSGQTFNAITHNRRMTVLTAVGQENKRAKDNLKENSEILEKARNEPKRGEC